MSLIFGRDPLDHMKMESTSRVLGVGGKSSFPLEPNERNGVCSSTSLFICPPEISVERMGAVFRIRWEFLSWDSVHFVGSLEDHPI